MHSFSALEDSPTRGGDILKLFGTYGTLLLLRSNELTTIDCYVLRKYVCTRGGSRE